ncbi:MAG TPA: hypothetical protein VHZ74_02815 [Bryobacteraceae bacterium]|jgi:hypothetical protein|nr:hypothetical protein [Bryobacteraceae bacterium]
MLARSGLATLLFCCAAFPQQPDQEIVAVYNQISQRAARLEPMLQQLHPKDWIAHGAPDTYLAQWTTAIEQFRAIQSDMSALAQQPEVMTESMKALFRIQTANQMLGSLMGGVRKYQNPALADLIESVAAEAGADIERIERHLVEIAGEKEQQFSIVDREAQRCRATLSKQPAESARPVRKPQ